MIHKSAEALEAGLEGVASSPIGSGRLELIVRRPAIDEREVLDIAELDLEVGLVGDTWSSRTSKRTPDGSPHRDMQLNVMNARAAALIAGERDRWPLAGDQLYVELHLGSDELPAGSRLAIGSAVIEVTDQPHTGCIKFAERFGAAAARLVNTEPGRRLNLRGINCRVLVPGTVHAGDEIAVTVPVPTSRRT
jgi:hypothetical protein